MHVKDEADKVGNSTKCEAGMSCCVLLPCEIFMATQRPERMVGVRLEVRGMKRRNGDGMNNKAV